MFALELLFKKDVCNRILGVVLQGRFASPNYPGFYGPSRDCLWVMTTSSDAQFTLICDPLSISCSGDYILYSPSGDTTFKDAAQPVCGYDIAFYQFDYYFVLLLSLSLVLVNGKLRQQQTVNIFFPILYGDK